MIRYTRPPEPSDFEARVWQARRALIEACSRGEELKEHHFPDHWSDYKVHFRTAQHDKCGYCETRLQEPGAVDHFRPKSAVWELPDDPEEWGDELPGTTSMRGRKHRELSCRGYYWLAYTWENYVFSCERCNTAWKQAFFPVREAPRGLPPDPAQAETPLLLNPFDDEGPWRHFEFGDLGSVQPASEEDDRGWETIRTCHLDRDSLRRARRTLLPAVLENLRVYRKGSFEARSLAWRTLCRMGSDDAFHAGMVRSRIEGALGVRWEVFLEREPRP